ncbi:MAG: T9SS type A sorting domain-containing protein [Crocinitomicaceae bacterium]|nr:T9SS type A sorting domain-containing protein [Crocinitomicaceae bacterium]
MNYLTGIFLFNSLMVFSQPLVFSPGKILEKTVQPDYYSTEYIFVSNNSESPVTVNFTLLSADVPVEWSVTGCTNNFCYVKIPDDGTLGTLAQGGEGFLSINLAANGTEGSGEISFVISAEEIPDYSDTLFFKYSSQNSSDTLQQNWAQINYSQQVIHVFLDDASVGSQLRIYTLSGELILDSTLEKITSFSIASFTQGVYIVAIRREDGKELVQKMLLI